MTIWEFRRRVRASRVLLRNDYCPLGAALQAPRAFRHPLPGYAERSLRLPWGYCLGVIAGFDHAQPPELPGQPGAEIFDAGERYGRRMRKVAKLRGYA